MILKKNFIFKKKKIKSYILPKNESCFCFSAHTHLSLSFFSFSLSLFFLFLSQSFSLDVDKMRARKKRNVSKNYLKFAKISKQVNQTAENLAQIHWPCLDIYKTGFRLLNYWKERINDLQTKINRTLVRNNPRPNYCQPTIL
jgi:hypothetical protein